MSLETGLLVALVLCSAATLVAVLLLRGALTREVRGLREKIDQFQEGGASRPAKPGTSGAPDPRLTAARTAAAARAAKRPGRTTVKRI